MKGDHGRYLQRYLGKQGELSQENLHYLFEIQPGGKYRLAEIGDDYVICQYPSGELLICPLGIFVLIVPAR